jgi:hypothetical protein
MKTKILLLLFSTMVLRLNSQDDVQRSIQEAQDFYTQKKFKEATLSLQDAINLINGLMALLLTEVLPSEINGLLTVEGGSANTGMGMMGGSQISKRYEHPTKNENEVDVQIFANSPMMSSMSMMLNNPSMMGQGAKSVRVGTQRAILKSEMEDYYNDDGVSKKIRSTQIQIPLNQTLITITARGFETEQEELAFASKLDIPKIKAAVGE